MPRLSVIIPVFQDWQRLTLCLEALERQSLPSDQFEIIVANNEPAPRCPLSRLPPNARMIHEPHPGSYAARNAAVTVSSGQYLAFTDSDCVPDTDWLHNGLAALEANPGARLAGSVSIFREPGGAHYAYVYDLHVAFRQSEYVTSGVCVTANLMVERRIFDRVGWFDPRFSGGDIAWNRRAQSAGVPIIYMQDVRVAHPARRNLREIFRKKRRTAASAAHEVSVRRVILDGLKPPVRSIVMLRRKDVRWYHAIMVFFILWINRILRAWVVCLVRIGLMRPTRT